MSSEIEGLRVSDFESFFKKIPHVFNLFSGVVAIDEIPKRLPTKHFVIVNLSEKHLPGSHWTVILRSSPNVLEVFNSLGQKDLNYFLPHFNFKRRYQIDFNKKDVQSIDSKYCGYFCIYFIVFRVLNYDMNFQDVLEDIFYSNDLNKNDEIVSKFCNNLLTNTNDDFFSFFDI